MARGHQKIQSQQKAYVVERKEMRGRRIGTCEIEPQNLTCVIHPLSPLSASPSPSHSISFSSLSRSARQQGEGRLEEQRVVAEGDEPGSQVHPLQHLPPDIHAHRQGGVGVRRGWCSDEADGLWNGRLPDDTALVLEGLLMQSGSACAWPRLDDAGTMPHRARLWQMTFIPLADVLF